MPRTGIGPDGSVLASVADLLAAAHSADAISAAYLQVVVDGPSVPVFAALAGLPAADLERMLGPMLLVAIARRRDAGLPASDHEVRHLIASFMVGDTDTCTPSTCRLIVGSDASVTLAPPQK